ncbi:MAG: hypothetical protein WBD31_04745 [Rubripirellula sp.]
MQITNEQRELILTTVVDYQHLFNSANTDKPAEAFYHFQADAICWSDELPDGLNYDAMRVVQFLLAARSQSYVDSQLATSGVLEKLRAIAPEWPFLREDRHDSKWEKTLTLLRSDGQRELKCQLEQRGSENNSRGE